MARYSASLIVRFVFTFTSKVSSLASLVEEEIFALHNKDTGSKYKNKYRQLLFNIKQPQNTLFRRIALEKTLSPYELVRLTADEMACTELAEWRQREAKHEIDMIKKTELENLQQSKVSRLAVATVNRLVYEGSERGQKLANIVKISITETTPKYVVKKSKFVFQGFVYRFLIFFRTYFWKNTFYRVKRPLPPAFVEFSKQFCFLTWIYAFDCQSNPNSSHFYVTLRYVT